jgi:hypothetical protein
MSARTRATSSGSERFGHVVVRAEVEAAHAVRLRVVGGEHQDAPRVAVAPQLAQDFEAVHSGEAHVEHDEVVMLFGTSTHRELPRFRVVDGVARLPERTDQPVRQRLVVFDNQNSHDKCLNRFEVQDSTREGHGFLIWAHGRFWEKSAWEHNALPRHRGGKRLRANCTRLRLAGT